MIFKAIVLLIITFSKFSYGYECNEKYLNISSNHTMCQKPNPQCNMTEKGLTKEDKDLIVTVHNEFRSKLAAGKEQRSGIMPPAANMLEMEWDDELAAIAQKHAEQCTFAHDCRECRRVEKFPVGQNIGKRASNYFLKKDFRKSITNFYEEVKIFNKSLIAAFSSLSNLNEYGHFTQVVWSESWKIGCGYVQYNDEINWFTSLLICNYGPGGNVIGKQIYKEGNSCSSCPENTCCGGKCTSFNVTANYPGLCTSYNSSDDCTAEMIN